MSRVVTLLSAVVLLAFVLVAVTPLEPLSAQVIESTFTVNSTGDYGDAVPTDDVCDTGSVIPVGAECTLRAAIEQANASSDSTAIHFDIPGAGPHTISPTSVLPEITAPLVIDGFTQPGASPNTSTTASGLNAVLMIEIDGSLAGVVPAGLDFSAPGAVRGLAINRFIGSSAGSNGHAVGTSAGGLVVEGNYLGTDLSGTVALPNSGSGVVIGDTHTVPTVLSVVGGANPEARNLISGNGHNGIQVSDPGVPGNVIQGNLIGTDSSGLADVGNQVHGIFLGAPDTIVGGSTPATRNVVSGNGDLSTTSEGWAAIQVSSNGNTIEGNFVGPDITGTATGTITIGNSAFGIRVTGSGNLIGGTTGITPNGPCTGSCNVVSGNAWSQIALAGFGAANNRVQGNMIGVDGAGTRRLTGGTGVELTGGASSNTIGGKTHEARNIISGNSFDGVHIADAETAFNRVEGNFIGIDTAGNAHAVGNGWNGINIVDASWNVIGEGIPSDAPAGACSDECNRIAENGDDGVDISGADASGNTVRRNAIYDNGGLGINLNSNNRPSDGVSPNDPGDPDAGPNGLLNFPVAVMAFYEADTDTTIVSGFLPIPVIEEGSVVDVYGLATRDPSGHGEGEELLGSVIVICDGDVQIDCIHPEGPFTLVLSGQIEYPLISATLTDVAGSTSEFSPVCGDPDQASQPGVDNDRDGLCDEWETTGIDYDGDGVVDLKLGMAPFNADPNRKDVFVEIDYMEGVTPEAGFHSHRPSDLTIGRVEEAFADAPLDDGAGVALHLMRDEDLAEVEYLYFLENPGSYDDFWDIKLGNPISRCGTGPTDGHLGTIAEREDSNCWNIIGARALVFHYAVSAHLLADDPELVGKSELGGNDLVLTTWPAANNDAILRATGSFDAYEARVLMHELGHNLGLCHGGPIAPLPDTDWCERLEEPLSPATGLPLAHRGMNYKPNYLSVMNYSFATGAGILGVPLDYSHWDDTTLRTLDESNLDEYSGILANPLSPPNIDDRWRTAYTDQNTCQLTKAGELVRIDWDADGSGTELNVQAHINDLGPNCAAGSYEVLKSFQDWNALQLNFRMFNEAFGSSFAESVTPPEITLSETIRIASEIDHDDDGVTNYFDNCPRFPNSAQDDSNSNGIGDVCEGEADLSVTKTASPDVAVPGQSITYSIDVRNLGPDSSPAVSLIDHLPADVSVAAVTTTQGACTEDSSIVSCDLGAMSFGDQALVEVVVTASAPGTYLNEASVVSGQPDPNPNDNVSEVTISVFPYFLVNSVADPGDGICDLAECTLREAINAANEVPGLDHLRFGITGPAPHVVIVQDELPTITDPIVIDGYTQPGASPNSGASVAGTDATLAIEIRPHGAGCSSIPSGLAIEGGGVTIRGLTIYGFLELITIRGNGGNTIEGNFLGFGATCWSEGGILVDNSPNNLIGGTAPTATNVIRVGGVRIVGQAATGNAVQGNLIGSSPSGIEFPSPDPAPTSARSTGITIENAPGNLIGGTEGTTSGGSCTGACNVIVGARGRAVVIHGPAAQGNVVQGNFIGLDATGTALYPRGVTAYPSPFHAAIQVALGAGSTLIGGSDEAARNLIANYETGIELVESDENVIEGNYLGYDTNGNHLMPVSGELGIVLTGSHNRIGGSGGTTPGGPCTGACNLVGGYGIGLQVGRSFYYDEIAHNTIQGNFLGTDRLGTTAFPNVTAISLEAIFAPVHHTVIGGPEPGEGNLISGSWSPVADYWGIEPPGISISGALSQISDTTIIGNYIGTDATGLAPLGNQGPGIVIWGGDGGVQDTLVEGNHIAFNGRDGVKLLGGRGTHLDSNSIHDNDRLGIDLGGNGVDPNDSGDIDVGPNMGQNYPILQTISLGPSHVVGTLDSAPLTEFAIQIFANEQCDSTGQGEGEALVAAGMVSTDPTGHGEFDVLLDAESDGFLTATATDPAGNTSEFSPCLEVSAADQPPSADAGGPYQAVEGSSVPLDGLGSVDPNQPAITLIFDWDLDADGLFGETGSAAQFGSEVGSQPILDAEALDGPTTWTIALRVTDSAGQSNTDVTEIAVQNAAPTMSVATVVSGLVVSVSVQGSDPGTRDTHEGIVDWEDGVSEPLALSGTPPAFVASATHGYLAAGTYNVTLCVVDDDGGQACEVIGVSVTVTPRALKEVTRSDLMETLPSCDSGERRINKAIARIGQSLTQSWWTSETELHERRGGKVFDREHQAVEELTKVRGSCGDFAQTAIERLVEVDRMLAQVALDAATNGGGDEERVDKALQRMEQAAGHVAGGDYANAVLAYKKAWQEAIKALKWQSLLV